MNILLISVVYPFPIDDGGRSGTFKMIEYLRHQHEITLICPENHAVNSNELQSLWPNVKIVTFKKPKETIEDFSIRGFVKKIAGSSKKTKKQVFSESMVLNNTDLSSYYFNNLVEIVQSEIAQNNYDFVQVDFIEMAPIVSFIPKNIKTLFVHHELRYKRMQLEYNTLNEKSIALEWKINSTKNLEIALLNLYDCVVCLTEIDKNILLNDGINANKLAVSPLPVNINEHYINKNFVFENKLVFLGPESHYPNLDGIDWFIKNCWQEILKKKPEVKLIIIGNWTEKFTKYYAHIENIVFAGFVVDLKKIMTGSIMVVPLRIGSGMRMKILEGASWHVPMVSTTIGSEGLPMHSGENCFIADKPEEFVAKSLELIENQSLQNSFIIKSQDVFKEGFSIEECGEIRNNLYNSLL